MHSTRIVPRLIFLISLFSLIPAAHALDETGAKAVIAKFLGSQKFDDGASASEAEHVIADLDGDGKPDLVLMWNVLGPTWHLPKLTLFIDQGRNYRTLTTDLTGLTEKLTIKGSTILVDTKTLGPNDPRCCPTKKEQMRFQWRGGKLVLLK